MFSFGGSRSAAPILGPKDHLATTRQLSSMPPLSYNPTKQFREFKYHQPDVVKVVQYMKPQQSSPSRHPHRKSPSKTKQKSRMMMEEIDEIGLDASEVVQTPTTPETSTSYTTCPLKIKLTDLLSSTFGCAPSQRHSTSPKNTASPKSCSASPIEFLHFSWFATPTTNNATCTFRKRLSSDCQSEDSFVVFANDEDDLESDCFTEDEDSDDTDAEDESSGEMCHDMAHMNNFVDSQIKKKKVSFETRDKLCVVHPMVSWSFAYRSARKGHWEELGRDRTRFSDRITNIAPIISRILNLDHRDTIYHQRFAVD